MTISSSTSKNQYTANGSNTIFAYTFKIFDEDDIRVLVNNTIQTKTTNYSVSGVGLSGGGNITFTSAPANGAIITIKRNEPLTQEIDYVDGDDFPASAHEEGLDRSVIRDQFLQEQLNRTILLPEGTTLTGVNYPEPEANKVIAWNGDATGLVNVAIDGTVAGNTSIVGTLSVTGSATFSASVSIGTTLSVAGLLTATSGVKIPNGQSIIDENNNELIKYLSTSSAVNEVSIANSATGDSPVISASGNDANIGIHLNPKGSGQIKIDNLTFPATDGTANQVLKTDGAGNLGFVFTNRPAFIARKASGAQSFGAGVTAKVTFDTEDLDTGNCFDNATNYRFTPNIAGYYNIGARISGASSSDRWYLRLYKNGAQINANYNDYDGGNGAFVVAGNYMVYMNGTTDYLEIFATNTGVSTDNIEANNDTLFFGYLLNII